jgi:hypothetical protein
MCPMKGQVAGAVPRNEELMTQGRHLHQVAHGAHSSVEFVITNAPRYPERIIEMVNRNVKIISLK